jgi:hypothetical protein
MMGIAVVGFAISAITLNIVARYISCFLFASAVYSVNSVILGWVSSTLGQTPEKKDVSLSMVNELFSGVYIGGVGVEDLAAGAEPESEARWCQCVLRLLSVIGVKDGSLRRCFCVNFGGQESLNDCNAN